MGEYPGIGVMLGLLGGTATNVNLNDLAGQKIKAFDLKDDVVTVIFESDRTVHIRDDGQSCCESRYITTDDTLSDYIGATFSGHELREVPTVDDEYGDPHEQMFLVLMTDRGNVTFTTHNEHNGYYGGFLLVCVEDSK